MAHPPSPTSPGEVSEPANALREEEVITSVRHLQDARVALGRATTAKEVGALLLQFAALGTRATSGAVARVSEAHRHIQILATRGENVDYLVPVDPCSLDAHVPLATAVKTGEMVDVQTPKAFMASYPRIVRRRVDHGVLCLPLFHQNRVWGALGVVFSVNDALTANHRAYLRALTRLAVDALSRATDHEAERKSRKLAESSAARLARLQRVTAALSHAADVATVAREVAREAVQGANARGCLVMGAEGDGPKILAKVVHPHKLPPRSAQLERCLKVVIESGEAHWPVAKEKGMPHPGLVCIPLTVEERKLGAVGIDLGKRRVTGSTRSFIMALAGVCAQSLDRARLYEAEREARALAERANRQKDDFLAVVSHEMRTPLTAMNLWISRLREVPPSAAELSQGLGRIASNLELQTRLVADLLDAARITNSKLEVALAPMDLPTAMAMAMDAYASVAEAKGVTLRLDLPEEPCPDIMGDSTRVVQVFANLIANAVKFTPSGGTVVVRLSVLSESARVEVIDTGEGIAPDLLPHMFEGFRQGDPTSNRRHGGLGLGLAIAKYLVEVHGGKVWAESKGRGQGATMTVELPFAMTDPASSEKPALLGGR